MKLDLDHIERVARAAQEEHPGPYKLFKYGRGVVPDASDGIDCIRDSAPEPDDYKSYASDEWQGETVLETDSGYYEPRGATAEHIAACSPDVVLALVARVRELEKRYEFDPDSGAHDSSCMARIGKKGGYWDCDCGVWK